MVPQASNNFSQRGANQSNNFVQKYLTNCKSFYSCIYCRTHLANHDELVSRLFQGNRGRAYLFNSVINISCGPSVQRQLTTGSHAVADIHCSNCGTTLGWKYEKAYVEGQKYKEGKFIIELAHVVRENRHLEFDKSEIFLNCLNNHQHSTTMASSTTTNSSSHPSPESNFSLNNETTNDDDDELIFPFFDELCPSRSSYSSNLSTSYRSRLRRSLYLDSTPYDWKTSPSSSSSSPPSKFSNQTALVDSIDLGSSTGSTDLSRSASSSSDDGSLKKSRSYRAISDLNVDVTRYVVSSRSIDANESETQFKFEADVPGSSGCSPNRRNFVQSRGINSRETERTYLEKINDGDSSENNMRSIDSSKRQLANSDLDEAQVDEQVQEHDDDDYSDQISNSLSQNDEEFYDCYTDHEITNSIMESMS